MSGVLVEPTTKTRDSATGRRPSLFRPAGFPWMSVRALVEPGAWANARGERNRDALPASSPPHRGRCEGYPMTINDRRRFLGTAALGVVGAAWCPSVLWGASPRSAARARGPLEITDIEIHEILPPFHDYNAKTMFR